MLAAGSEDAGNVFSTVIVEADGADGAGRVTVTAAGVVHAAQLADAVTVIGAGAEGAGSVFSTVIVEADGAGGAGSVTVTGAAGVVHAFELDSEH